MEFPRVRPPIGWMTIPEYIERSCEKHAEIVAMQIRRGKDWYRVTYEQLLDRIKRVAAFLKDFGIRKGDRVSVLGENRPEWGICYLAIQWIGGIVVPLDARLKAPEYRHIMNDAEVRLLFVSKSRLSEIEEISNKVESLEKIVTMDPVNGYESLDDILAKYKEGVPRERLSLEDWAVILYTSGTTGTSKGVVLSHKNIASNIDAIYQIIELRPGEVSFSFLPLHHVFEATAGFLFTLVNGVTITFARSLKPNEMREDMQAVRPHLMTTVPLLLEKFLIRIRNEVNKSIVKKGLMGGLKIVSKGLSPILGKQKVPNIVFKSLLKKLGLDRARYIVSGGAALPRWVSKGLEELGFPIIQGYGLSETSPVLTVNPPCCPRNESVGLPIPYVEIKIMDPNEEGVGEIAARGPNVMVGYYKNPEATAEVITEDGWFLTGDMGYLDKDGFLYITGRKKSVIVTPGGKNIYPEEVENVLLQSPYIEEVLVLRGANPETGAEEVQAIVYPNFEALDEYFKSQGIEHPTEKQVYEKIREEIETYSRQLAEYKRPRRFTLRDEEFPKTTTRKIKRYLFEQTGVPISKEKK